MSRQDEPTSSTIKSNGTPQKSRARLGPTEIVQLPASDSEPEDLAEDDESFVEVEGESAGDDFLKDYPEDTEVRRRFNANHRSVG